jgi:hypothetical protein
LRAIRWWELQHALHLIPKGNSEKEEGNREEPRPSNAMCSLFSQVSSALPADKKRKESSIRFAIA